MYIRMHSSAVTHPDGSVFMFGQNTHGQVGVAGVKSLLLPADVNLGHPPHHQMTEKVSQQILHRVGFFLFKFTDIVFSLVVRTTPSPHECMMALDYGMTGRAIH